MTKHKRTYNRANPALIRPQLEQAQRYAKLGIQFVPMPVFSDEEALEKAKEASARLSEVTAEIEAEEAKASTKFKA